MFKVCFYKILSKFLKFISNSFIIKQRNFMFDFVYVGSRAKEEEKKVFGIIKGIFEYYTENPGAMPLNMQEIAWKEGVERAVCDYIAGMSDRFAIYTFNNIYVPRSWNKL